MNTLNSWDFGESQSSFWPWLWLGRRGAGSAGPEAAAPVFFDFSTPVSNSPEFWHPQQLQQLRYHPSSAPFPPRGLLGDSLFWAIASSRATVGLD